MGKDVVMTGPRFHLGCVKVVNKGTVLHEADTFGQHSAPLDIERPTISVAVKHRKVLYLQYLLSENPLTPAFWTKKTVSMTLPTEDVTRAFWGVSIAYCIPSTYLRPTHVVAMLSAWFY